MLRGPPTGIEAREKQAAEGTPENVPYNNEVRFKPSDEPRAPIHTPTDGRATALKRLGQGIHREKLGHGKHNPQSAETDPQVRKEAKWGDRKRFRLTLFIRTKIALNADKITSVWIISAIPAPFRASSRVAAASARRNTGLVKMFEQR